MDSVLTYPKLRKALDGALFRDRNRILSKASRVFGSKLKPLTPKPEELKNLTIDLAAALKNAEERSASIPVITYPEELPVSKAHAELAELIRKNQVVIIAGDTGSGKTTQLPKICLEAGFGRRGMIGHTQPRRLAARTVAQRISDELNVPLGTTVGYKIRFGDKTAENTIIKLMTDGVLLTEMEQDRRLSAYEVLIIDEAHERSLNIDFILGFLHRLLPKRPELHVVITSATIDPDKFSRHFWNAPVRIVEGRTYPVEVRYEPIGEIQDPDDEPVDEDDFFHALLRAVDELGSENPLGDILVFLNGEKDITETAVFLQKCHLKGTEILPLYARLSNLEQNKVFQTHQGRRIVLATNVAETSITVPGIRFVIDPGTARISRYSSRTKVQRLPIERISRASADQRKGRSGRLAAGICIRLYSEYDYNSRPEFTDAEILRTNLAQVILRMLSLKIYDIEGFPFVDPPERKQIQDGIKVLEELGAVVRNEDNMPFLTKVGLLMAKLPCDPTLSRMIVEAQKQSALRETLIIAAGISAQEVRERPLAYKAAADAAHARFNDEKSDFIAYINLYNYLQDLRKSEGSSGMRRRMKKEFLSYLRMREWFDILDQLQSTAEELGFKENQQPATYDELHRSLLTGLITRIGMKQAEGNEFVGSRGLHFYIFPGSSLAKKPPKWVMAAEIAETSKVYARTVAEIDPLWVEEAAPELIRYSYSDPSWSKKSGNATALEKGTIYGLAVIVDRKVNYTKVDPAASRILFIREGLVQGELFTQDKFFKHNLNLVQEVEDLEDKSRRRDILVSEETLFDFYDERIPDNIPDLITFEKWWRGMQEKDAHFLDYDMDMLKQNDTSMINGDSYPDHLPVGNIRVPLTYNFEPGAEDDGVTAVIPVSVLNQIPDDIFLWLIPGLRAELFTSLIRVLPKALRRHFVPAPDYAARLFKVLTPGKRGFWEALTDEMTQMAGMPVKKEDFDTSGLETHLTFYFRIINDKKKTLMAGRDLAYIRHKLKDEVKTALNSVIREKPKEKGTTAWTFKGRIPETETRSLGKMDIVAYPALKDEGKSVSVELFSSPEEADYQMHKGLRRLIVLGIPSPLSYLEEKLPNKAKLAMYFNAVGTVKSLIADLECLALDEIIKENGGTARDEDGFNRLKKAAAAEIADRVLALASKTETILVKANEVLKKLKGHMDLKTAMAYSDMGGQLSRLIYEGFATETTMEYFGDLPRYLEAMLKRIEKVPRDPNRDLLLMKQYKEVEDNYESLLGMFVGKVKPHEVVMIKFMLEELRVSLFAQSLKTKYPVSPKRVNNEIERLKALYQS